MAITQEIKRKLGLKRPQTALRFFTELDRREYHIKKVDSSANTVTISPQGSSTIDGETSAVIGVQYSSCRLYSDGSNFYIL